MPRYYSSFAAGFETLAADFLARDIPLIGPPTVMNGAIIYDTAAKPDAVREIKYFKNSFMVLGEYSDIKSIENLAAVVSENTPKIHAPYKARSFHIVLSDKNQPRGIDGATKARLITSVQRRTNLRYRSGHGDVEFWVLLRGDGNGFFMQRITIAAREPVAGELETHTANLLCRASEPGPDDIFIDPFCGSGSIPLARARMHPYRGIFAMDIDINMTDALKLKIKAIHNSRIQKSFFVKNGDWLCNNFQDNFADAIITDPPWGMHSDISDDFYPWAMREFTRVLKIGGRLVLLTAREIEIPVQDNLSIVAEYDVLIHGKKASVRIFVKK